MKSLFKLTVFSFMIVSCNHETEVCANVNIHNETKYIITLEAFNKKRVLNTINIPANKTYSNIQTFGTAHNYLGVFADEIDSLNIKFNDERIIVQYCGGRNLGFCPNIEKNVFYEWDRQVLEVGSEVKLLKKNGCQILRNPYEFSFNQADYDRAVPIVK